MFNRLKRILSIVIAVSVILGFTAISAVSADAAAETVNATEVTIYALDDWAKEYISIPDDYPQSFQLTVTSAGRVSYSCDSNYAQVSDTGLITPYVETYYWYGNWGTTSPMPDREPSRSTHDIMFGASTVTVRTDSQVFKVRVTVEDYAEVYADRVMDEYLAQNVKPSMTTYEKLKQIGAFIASFEYSVYQSSAVGMIVAGGGDCWASSNTVVRMAEKLGLDAWYRNGNRDPGAGSGHMNAMVYDGSAYYEVEAGYYMPVPRSYDIKERTSLFSYRYDSTYGGITVYQYDGKTVPTKFEVPQTINGETVTSIGSRFLSSVDEVTEVTLPDTVCAIESSAFNSCIHLQTINLPESLKTIDELAFANCNSLTDIKSGGDYTVIDGAIYQGNTLVAAPAVSTLTIPSGVTEIAPYALYYNHNITTAVVPASVTKIGLGAFGDCDQLTNLRIEGEGLNEIEDFVVANTPLKELMIPASVDQFGDHMMEYADETTLIVVEGSPAEQYAKEHDLVYRIFTDTLLGDADDDGSVTILDATAIQRKLANLSVSAYNEQAADADQDGSIMILDATAIQRYLASLPTNDSIGKRI